MFFFYDGVKRKACDCAPERRGRKLLNYLSCDSRRTKLLRKSETWRLEKDLSGCFSITLLMANSFHNIFKLFIFSFPSYMLIENLCAVRCVFRADQETELVDKIKMVQEGHCFYAGSEVLRLHYS